MYASHGEDIDDRGRLVGVSGLVTHGYLADGRGRPLEIDAPAVASDTVPSGVNGRGEIVGFSDVGSAGSYHGFLRDRRGRFRRIDVPGAAGTASARINDHGQIVGYCGRVAALAEARRLPDPPIRDPWSEAASARCFHLNRLRRGHCALSQAATSTVAVTVALAESPAMLHAAMQTFRLVPLADSSPSIRTSCPGMAGST